MRLLISLVVFVSGSYMLNMEKDQHAPTEENIFYKLEAEDSIEIGEPVNIHFILENRSDKDLFFLRWYTPFEGFNSDMFRITRNGEEIRYEGRMVKRGNQSLQDYLEINHESTIDTVLELSSVYNLTEEGEYEIQYVGKIYDVISAESTQRLRNYFPRSPDDLHTVDIAGNSISIKVGVFQSP